MAKSNDNVDQHKLFSSDVTKMPEGYYSGDKPNTKLRSFVEEHISERPYDPSTDDYVVPAFDRAIETSKATAIYNMHTYWSKKPHDAIQQYIQHFTVPGDLVLDPFSGSGGTALATLIEGRKSIAIDASPAATFITAGYCMPLPADFCISVINEFLNAWRKECEWSYEIICPECNKTAIIETVVHSDRYECLKCLTIEPIYNLIDREYCTKCNDKVTVTKNKRIDMVPVSFSIKCKKCGHNTKTTSNQVKADYLRRITDIQSSLKGLTVPHAPIPNARVATGRMRTTKTEHVDELYYPRSLYCMAIAFDLASKLEQPQRHFIEFCLTSMCLFVTKMHQANESTGGNISKGSYYVPPVNKEMNVFSAFVRKANAVTKGLSSIKLGCNKIIVSTESCTDLTSIPNNSIDYIFTDPPYSDKVPFSDLNLPWEAWLKFDTEWIEKEIIIHPDQQKGIIEWSALMKKAFQRMYDVLKPGRWLTLCYHDTSDGSWSLIQDMATEVGFIPDSLDNVLYIDVSQKSFQQIVADKVNKRDLVINFRKPRYNETKEDIIISINDDMSTFNDKARKLISSYIERNPGCTKDRIFDEIVSHMVRAGRMETHNFEELLLQVAEGTEGVSGIHWYLKDSSLDIMDAAESAKEDTAADNISKYIAAYIEKHPTFDGVHYSDIFEHFVYTVKIKPRRALAEWLLDYFFKTDDGTYRLPISEEEKRLKAEGRSNGTQRRIKRYLAFLQQGVAIPEKERASDSTIAEWIRHCKRSGLYEQGKLLYEKGGLNIDTLTEEALVNIEEDYQVCARMLGRTSASNTETKSKRGRKAKS